MVTEHRMEISCHIRCEILDAEGLCIMRVKLWTPPAQDVEWVNPHNKQTLPLLGPIGRLHLYDEELTQPRGLLYIPCCAIMGSPYAVYTAAVQDLEILYQPMVAKYAQAKYGGLVTMPKYGIFSRDPPQGKNKFLYDQWIF